MPPSNKFHLVFSEFDPTNVVINKEVIERHKALFLILRRCEFRQLEFNRQ